MYIVIVWTGGPAALHAFGPYIGEEQAILAAEQANQAWGWECLVTELDCAGTLLALPPVLAPSETLREYDPEQLNDRNWS